jgi:hypothetical protein
MMETKCRGSAATFEFTAVIGIDQAKPSIEVVTDEHEATFPTERFLVVNYEVLISHTLGTPQFIGRFRVRVYRLVVLGGSLVGV